MNNNLHGGFTPDGQLTGRLSSDGHLSGKLTPTGHLTGKLSNSKSYKPYTGEYEVIPKARIDQVLDTTDKLLTDDVVVREIPYEETHNESGITICIG